VVAQGVRAVSAGRAATDRLRQINELLLNKQLRPYVGAVFPLAEARKAMELSQTGHGRGRIVLKIAEK